MLRTCRVCHQYTLQAACPQCGQETEDPAPPKFSPDDKYGAYRRKLKRLNETDDADGGER